jgi:hypothetical protein
VEFRSLPTPLLDGVYVRGRKHLERVVWRSCNTSYSIQGQFVALLNDLMAIIESRLCLLYCSFVVARFPGKPALHTAPGPRFISSRVNSVKYVVVSVFCDQV